MAKKSRKAPTPKKKVKTVVAKKPVVKVPVVKVPVVKKPVPKKPVKTKTIVPPVVAPTPEPIGALIPDGGYEVVTLGPPVEPFDAVIVQQVPVCEERSGHVIKMNFYNAAGQLVR